MADPCRRDLLCPRDQAVLGVGLREAGQLDHLVDAELATIESARDGGQMGERCGGLDQPPGFPVGHPVAHPQPLRQVARAVVRPRAGAVHLVDGREELDLRVTDPDMGFVAPLDSCRSSISLVHRGIAPIRGRRGCEMLR